MKKEHKAKSHFTKTLSEKGYQGIICYFDLIHNDGSENGFRKFLFRNPRSQIQYKKKNILFSKVDIQIIRYSIDPPYIYVYILTYTYYISIYRYVIPYACLNFKQCHHNNADILIHETNNVQHHSSWTQICFTFSKIWSGGILCFTHALVHLRVNNCAALFPFAFLQNLQ